MGISKVNQITISTRKPRSFAKGSGAGVQGLGVWACANGLEGPTGDPDGKPRSHGHKESLRTDFRLEVLPPQRGDQATLRRE